MKGKEKKNRWRKEREEKNKERVSQWEERSNSWFNTGKISIEGKPVVIENSFDTYQNSSHQKISPSLWLSFIWNIFLTAVLIRIKNEEEDLQNPIQEEQVKEWSLVHHVSIPPKKRFHRHHNLFPSSYLAGSEIH